MKFIHREGTQIAVYVQVKDLYQELSNNYVGDMPDIVRLSFRFKEEFSLIEDLYLRYTNSDIVNYFMKVKYIPEYDKIAKMSDESYEHWRAYYNKKLAELREQGPETSAEVINIKYMLNEAETIKRHPDRLKFPSHEIYPMFVMA